MEIFDKFEYWLLKLFIREKMGQQAKSQPEKLARTAFSFWLKSQFFSYFKSHLPNTFWLFDQPTSQKPKAYKKTKLKVMN